MKKLLKPHKNYEFIKNTIIYIINYRDTIGNHNNQEADDIPNATGFLL